MNENRKKSYQLYYRVIETFNPCIGHVIFHDSALVPQGHTSSVLCVIQLSDELWIDEQNKSTPLFIACLNGGNEIVELLLTIEGINMELTSSILFYFRMHKNYNIDSEGVTPLEIARTRNRREIVKKLSKALGLQSKSY